jgi:hypothetical protein
MEEAKKRLAYLIDGAKKFATQMSAEQRQKLLEQMQSLDAMIKTFERQSSKPPASAELLFALADGNANAFVNYARQIPNVELNALAKDPRRLQEVFQQLKSKVTFPAGEVKDGVPKAPLQSSNVWGFQYDPRQQLLRVRFQEGGIYEYDGVPPAVFKLLQAGAIPAKTNGQNRFGLWFRGKKPSIGATMYEAINKGGYNYRKVA